MATVAPGKRGKAAAAASLAPVSQPLAVPGTVFTRRPALRLDGQAAPALDAALMEVELIEQINSPATLSLQLDLLTLAQALNPRAGADLTLPALWRVPALGQAIEIRLDPAQAEASWSGRVHAVGADYPAGGPPCLQVLAADNLQAWADARHSRRFDKVLDADILRQLAAEHGLVADVDLPGQIQPVVVQMDASDLDFAQQRALAADARFRVDGSRLLVRRFDASEAPVPVLALGQSLSSFSVMADLRGQPTRLTMGGWSVATGRSVATEVVLSGRSMDVAGGVRADQWQARAFGERRLSMADLRPATATQAKAAGQILLAQQARRFVQAQARVAGAVAGLRVGGQVDLQGVGPLHGGRYRVMQLVVRFDPAAGVVTELALTRNALGPA